jgi:hypothetical protein
VSRDLPNAVKEGGWRGALSAERSARCPSVGS